MESPLTRLKTRSVLALVIGAVAAVFLLKIFLLDVMRVQGKSMEPTLKPGELIFVDRWAFGIRLPYVSHYLLKWGAPRRNSLVVFTNPLDGLLVVKRCIGLQGDPVAVENRMLRVANRTIPITKEEAKRFEKYRSVPPGTIFALGDNVAVSEDSRVYGFIPVSHILGSVFFELPGDAGGASSGG